LYAKNIEGSYKSLKEDFKEKERQLNRKVYELLVLESVGDKIGYSLNVQKIAEIITESIGNLVPYTTVSYILILPEKVILRSNLKESINKKFVENVKKRMLESIFTLIENKKLVNLPLDEGLSGRIVDESKKGEVSSFFNIPLVIGNKVRGLINVASIEGGLYNEEDMSILYGIAEKASNAVSKLQEILESEKGKVEVTVESMDDGVLMVDMNLEVQITNQAFRNFLKLKIGQKSMFNVIEAFSGNFKLEETIKESLRKDGTVIEPEVNLYDKFYRIIISPVKSEKDTLGVVLLMQDITNQKNLERMREDFSSMMIHDLRAPLSVIFGTSDLLIKRERTLAEEKKAELLFQIKNSSNSMLGIVDKLMDVSKLESGKFKLKKSKVNINELIKSQGKYFSMSAKKRKISTIYTLDPKMVKINLDEEMMVRVLNNLISNAIKFTKDEGTINLTSTLDKSKKQIVVSVRDNGVGIPKDQMDKLFSKFKQALDPVDSKSKGTGLGLVIAKGIIEAHEGNIWVESTLGKGSNFIFTLPFK